MRFERTSAGSTPAERTMNDLWEVWYKCQVCKVVHQSPRDHVCQLAEAELDQFVPAKDKVVGSNPTSET